MTRRSKKSVKDIFAWADVGEMLLSFFAAATVLASPTIVPEAFSDAGLWLAGISIVVIYVAIYTIIRIKKTGIALIESFYHLSSAIIITIIAVAITGYLYGFIAAGSRGRENPSPFRAGMNHTP